MDRINTPTKAVDLFGAGKHGFKNGDLALGIIPTDCNAEFFNNLQEELLTVIESKGLVPSAGARNQLHQAIGAMINDGGLTAAADPTFVDNSAKPASTSWIRGAMSAIATAAGFSYSFGPTGWIRLPSWLGGFMMLWGAITSTAFGVTFPIAFPNNLFKIFITPDQNTATAVTGDTLYISSSSLTGFNRGFNGISAFYFAIGN